MGAPRLSLRVKLLAGTLTLVVLSGVISLLAIKQLGNVNDAGHNLYEHAYGPAVAAGEAESRARDLNLQSVKMEAIVIAKLGPERGPASPEGQKILAAVAADQKILDEVTKELRDAPPELSAQAKALTGSIAHYKKTLADAVAARERGDMEAVARLNPQINPAGLAITEAAGEFGTASERYAESARADMVSANDSGRLWVLIALGIVALLGVGIALALSESIRRGVAQILDRLRSLQERDTAALRRGLDAVAEGDLTRRVEMTTTPIEKPGADEIGDVAR